MRARTIVCIHNMFEALGTQTDIDLSTTAAGCLKSPLPSRDVANMGVGSQEALYIQNSSVRI